MVTGDPKFNILTANVDALLARAVASTSADLDSTNPDLGRFAARGGKLILYHGWNDPAISRWNSIDYLQKRARANGRAKIGVVPAPLHGSRHGALRRRPGPRFLRAASAPTPAAPPPADATTEGSVDVNGQHILYEAIAGTITVGATDQQDAQLEPTANPSQTPRPLWSRSPKMRRLPRASFTSRTSRRARNRKTARSLSSTTAARAARPSGCTWVRSDPNTSRRQAISHAAPAPYKLIDNAYSLLDANDLVFIDMPGTGFGQLYGKDKEKAFWGIDEDANAFARFIMRFLGKYNRWNSPKYLFGESYGTTRSVLSNILEQKSVDLNGVILLSLIFNFTSDIDAARGNPGIDLPYVLALPTYAASAWYHQKLPQQPAALEPFLKEVEDYATGDYAHALSKGTDLPVAEKEAVAEKLHTYIGLPAAYLVKADLCVSGSTFEKNLQDEHNLTTGRLDTRFSGPSIDPLSEGADYDPQSSAISSAYVSLFNEYVRHDLKYGVGQTYLPEAIFGSYEWDFKHKGNFLTTNVSSDLATAMKQNPRLHVMVNGGYYDLATSFYAALYEDKHLPVPASLSANIEYDWYESGHMVYVREESLKQLHDRVAAFIKSTGAGNK